MSNDASVTRDGGPAFPQNDAVVNRINNEAGMSLRDYFAAHIVGGIFASGRQSDIAAQVRIQQRAFEMGLSDAQIGRETNKVIAMMSYEIADAMLAERAK